jgi:hypothetical protein
MRRQEKGTVSHHYSGPDFGFPRGDARLDFTDLYAFPKPSNATKSILVMNVHPSAVVSPPGPTTAEPFAPEALYELKIDTNDDVVADIAYRVRFSVSQDGSQTATLRRVEGEQAAGKGEGGQVVVASAPVSTGRDARVTEAGEYRFFAGWRSDPFFFDVHGMLNHQQFTGHDLKCLTLTLGPNRSACGPVRWSARSRIGFRQTAARCLRKLSSSLERREKPTCQANLRTMAASFPSSHTLSST